MGMFLVPLHLMSTVDWCFCATKYKTVKSFQTAVKARCSQNKHHGSWKPRHVILPCIDTVGIHCGDTFLVLKTSNPEGFTSVSLLYKFHNAVCQRLDEQHVELLYLVRISPADPSHGMVKFRAMLKTGGDDGDDDDAAIEHDDDDDSENDDDTMTY
jgi:hypothetical protein